MVIIDCTPAPAQQSAFSTAFDQTKQVLSSALSNTSESKAQDTVVNFCAKVFNNKFTMLKNVPIPGADLAVPLLLIGPPGIFLLATSGVKGVYRAKEESWLKMRGQTRQYQPDRPNLIQQSLAYKASVEQALADKGRTAPELHSLLVFTSPGVHIDTVRPAVRVVLMDGLERFTSSLLQKPPVYDTNELKRLVNLFHQPAGELVEERPSARDSFDFREEAEKKPIKRALPAQKPLPAKATPQNKSAVGASFANLTKKQWIFIGGLLFVQIVVLMGIILMLILAS